ncbi:hypothetical protein AB1Y20_011331 [Prymnesium parvum]|uniref:Glycerol kinase n=1 Tax=Prymnesium parvum TaxID=97485 RepID=A0AB34IPU5_PRYPA
MGEAVLALDAGTSAVKAVCVTLSHRRWDLVSEATSRHSDPEGSSGAAEQNAAEWWESAVRAARELRVTQPLLAISLSGQMQSVVLVDKGGRPLRPALLYSDSRASKEAAELEAQFGKETLHARTLNWKGAVSVLPKLLWLQRHEPHAVAAAAAVSLSAHDFLYLRLTGEHATDRTNASTTGLLNSTGEAWAVDFLREAGLCEQLLAKLPRLAPFAEAAPLRDDAAAALSLAAGTAVCLGSGDLGAATVGALGGARGAYCYLGTSGWVAAVLPRALRGECKAFTVLSPREGADISAAPMTCAGGNIAWARALLFAEWSDAEAYAQMDAAARSEPPGSGGLVYLPYLSGERCPVNDPTASACFVGLRRTTTRASMCRAVFEGICFAVRSLLPLLPQEAAELSEETLAELHAAIFRAESVIPSTGQGVQFTLRAPRPPPLTLVGGVAKSAVLPQILADVLQREVHVPSHPEHAPALGAAALGVAASEVRSPASAWALNREEQLPRSAGHECDIERPPPERRYVPNPELRDLYDRCFDCYCEVHPALRAIFPRLSL